MSKNRLNTYYFNSTARELNTQLNPKCRSNSLLHHTETSNKEYKNRISLSPLGEPKLELRDQIPTYHIRDIILKTNYLNELDAIKAFEKADIESDINAQLKRQKYQLLLEKDLNINNICKTKNNEIKVHNSDNFLESSKSIRSQSETKFKNTNKKKFIKKKKNEFLSLIGVDVDNLSINNINIDIDKAWDFVLKWAKGRNVDEILRYKVVNSIMSLTEQKASEKVKKIYQKLELYKEYKRKQKREEMRKKKEEEKKRMEELKKMDPTDLIRLKMKESLSKEKTFPKEGSTLTSRPKMKKRKQKVEEVVKTEVIKLNAYNDVDEIINFIDKSRKNSQSKFCKDHFNNIRRTKTMDQKMKNLMYKNLIIERK